MNILFVCSAKSWGGNEKWSTMAIKTLSEEHNLFFFGRKAKLGNRFAEGFPQGFAPMFANWDLFSFFIAFRFLKKHKIDLIVSTKKKEYFIFGLLSRILKIKHLIRLGIVRDMNRPLWHNLIYNKLNDGIIANAHRIELNLKRFSFMKNKPVHVIYNAIPGLNKLIQIPLKPSGKFHIVSTGMLTRRKGFHILIDAIAQLSSAQQKEITLTIVGEGRDEEELKNQVKKYNLEKKITFAGFQKDPIHLLSKANLFVLLSENEGISNALLEAMALGIPVLTTNSGGTSEFIDNKVNGVIVERNPNTVSAEMSDLLSKKEQLSTMGSKGKETVKQLFSENRFKKEMLQIVDSI